MDHNGKVNILLVDDSPEKVLALEATLADLGENLLRAYSGREALRCLLQQEVALILLDVNMPGMDGFETAAMIRARQATRDIPIIFVTVSDEQTHVSRGYSLGAVDYISSPVLPEVLRTKVCVFVDVFKKTQQITRQAAWLRQRATQLHKLTSASLAINSALSTQKMLEVVTDAAREITSANQAFTTLIIDQDWAQARTAASLAKKYDNYERDRCRRDGSGLCELVCGAGTPIRLTEQELEQHPLWATGWSSVRAKTNGSGPPVPMRGWLAVPLTGRDGRNLGLVEVSDREEGDFTGDDEAILVQLAQLTSIAIENANYAEEREVNRIKDEFLWTLSHELRTPLNAILGWAQLLRTEELSPEMANGIEVIERSAKAQAKLVEDMLDLSRVTRGNLRLGIRAISLKNAVQRAVEALMPAAEAKSIAIDCSLDVQNDVISGDPDRLQQVVWNLLSNAIKFTPPGGHIQVRLEPKGSDLQVMVKDDGEGISPAFLPYVFDRFRQADSTTTRRHSGLGIGLAIVRHIVELHGGTVHVDSEGPGQGSTFTVTLRAAGPRESTPDAKQLPRPVDRHKAAQNTLVELDGVRVLIVDDEPDARQMLGQMLDRLKAEVKLAGSAAEAIGVLREWHPHVLVSDIAMPGEDGYDLIRQVREMDDGERIPAIALTAYARDEDRLRAESAGFESHLAKPAEPAELTATIAKLSKRPAPHRVQPM